MNAKTLEALEDAQLREFGWAPGGYLIRCIDCGGDGGNDGCDKRAIRCKPCAQKRKAQALASSTARSPVEGLRPGDLEWLRAALQIHEAYEALVGLNHDAATNRRKDRILAALSAPIQPQAEGETDRGGAVDMRRVAEALGFEPDNHHNAASCPYCNPNGWQFAPPHPEPGEL